MLATLFIGAVGSVSSASLGQRQPCPVTPPPAGLPTALESNIVTRDAIRLSGRSYNYRHFAG